MNGHLPFHLTIKESVQVEIRAVPRCPVTFPPLFNKRVIKGKLCLGIRAAAEKKSWRFYSHKLPAQFTPWCQCANLLSLEDPWNEPQRCPWKGPWAPATAVSQELMFFIWCQLDHTQFNYHDYHTMFRKTPNKLAQVMTMISLPFLVIPCQHTADPETLANWLLRARITPPLILKVGRSEICPCTKGLHSPRWKLDIVEDVKARWTISFYS